MRRVEPWALVIFAVILLLGTSARFYKLEEKSLWSDEIATIATSMGNSIDPEAYALRGENFDPPAPVTASVYRAKATQSYGAGNLGQTVEVLKTNVHPPLFFWLMNLWIHAVGLEPGLLRVPAVLFGVLSIVLMFGLSLRLADLDPKKFSGNRREIFALLTSAMMALSAYQVDHAQDARQYTFLICLALGAVWLVVALIQKQGKSLWRWGLLALLLAAGIYSQYFFVLFVFFIFALLVWAGRRQTSFLVKTLACGLIVGLLFLPWLTVFQEQLVFLKMAGHYTAGLWNSIQLPEKLWRIFSEFFLPDSKIGKVLPLLVLLCWGGGVWFERKRNHVENKRFTLSPVLALSLAWLVFLVGGQILLDLVKNSHTATIRRYLLLVSPACYLLMAYGLCALIRDFGQSRWRWLPAFLTTLLFVLMAGDTLNSLLKTHTSSDEFKQAAERINRFSGPNDLVLISKTGAMAVGLAYYLKPETRMLGVDVSDAQALAPGSPLLAKLSKVLPDSAGQGRVWLVFSHTAASTRSRLQAWLEQKNYQVGDEFKVPGVRVLRGSLEH